MAKITEDTIAISKRFFEALNALIVRGDLDGKKTFTDKYEINRRNFYTVEKEPEKQSVSMVWIAYMVKDFDVSAKWLLTGQGKMFSKA